MLREIVESVINEGTSATVTVLKNGKYYTSFVQYDGYDSYMKPLLNKFFEDQKSAEKLVTSTGEIRGINSTTGKVDYYKDRKLLKIENDEEKAINNMNQAGYKYYWDGQTWNFYQGSIKSLRDFKKF
jgi:hypothetical protein